MNSIARAHYRDRLFFRSCLESAPADHAPKRMAFPVAARPNDRVQAQLHQLKQRLLHSMLEQTSETILFKPICGAANQAMDLAWENSCPLLVYPCLFEELVQAIREQWQPNLNEELDAGAGSTLSDFDYALA